MTPETTTGCAARWTCRICLGKEASRLRYSESSSEFKLIVALPRLEPVHGILSRRDCNAEAVRSKPIHRFPFYVLYRSLEGEITIVAVAHRCVTPFSANNRFPSQNTIRSCAWIHFVIGNRRLFRARSYCLSCDFLRYQCIWKKKKARQH